MAQRARIAKLRETMARLSLDAFFLSQPESRLYLSGFTGRDHPPNDSAGFLFVTPTQALLLTDGRTTEQAEKEAPFYQVERIEDRLGGALARAAAQMSLARVAIEANHLTVRRFEEVKTALGDSVTLVPTYDVEDQMRAVKEPGELEAIREAVDLADRAFTHLLGVVTPGMAERELAWEIEAFLRKNGSEGVAFDPIVAGGPNSSMPHHVPGDRRLQAGEPIVIDWGARVRGYCSDITRTIVLGEAGERFKKYYAVVLEAQTRAEKRIRAGMTGAKADALARNAITEAGLGEAFSHSLGHGVGLAVHESPSLRRTSEDVLEDGMVFSVSPGIYLPGWGGIRIEDLVTLRGGKPIVLSRSPKELETVEV